jgi:hypothetical protein
MKLTDMKGVSRKGEFSFQCTPTIEIGKIKVRTYWNVQGLKILVIKENLAQSMMKAADLTLKEPASPR